MFRVKRCRTSSQTHHVWDHVPELYPIFLNYNEKSGITTLMSARLRALVLKNRKKVETRVYSTKIILAPLPGYFMLIEGML
ncbi:hypothetical protein VNO78_24822 [Psophocarpus tetragonolobus]|uniref:Uncharacterized protein n=1 Tax=Psophocarpus tetragonolobus TaxID=3891 RepID=A0AAN9XEY1_PSOTE